MNFTFFISQDIIMIFIIFTFFYYLLPYAVAYNFNTLHSRAHEVNVLNDKKEPFDEPGVEPEVEPEDNILNVFEHNEIIETKEDDDDDSMKYIKSDTTTIELLNRCNNTGDGAMCQGMYAPIEDFENNALERQLS